MFIQIFTFMCGCGMKQSTNPLSGTICTYTTEPSVLYVTLIIVCEFEVSLFVRNYTFKYENNPLNEKCM